MRLGLDGHHLLLKNSYFATVNRLAFGSRQLALRVTRSYIDFSVDLSIRSQELSLTYRNAPVRIDGNVQRTNNGVWCEARSVEVPRAAQTLGVVVLSDGIHMEDFRYSTYAASLGHVSSISTF
eukprot:TRINITY_DN8602_c0_g1_i1.p1 TRINITY_DN8602_c0_g1~~TRINITY_DN8602_c0_g1_i1.p1  ORF type:complete len:123 (-),score=3.48 TRINITY_DN8602_c0_g1_i1:427-795(-)